MQQVKGEASVNKLILLFVFDKMESPLSESNILDMCTSSNNWLSYMDCSALIKNLLDVGFICDVNSGGEPLYTITADGRMCLANYYVKIPTSTRAEISTFIKNNRTRYRKKQEFFSDYFKNKDGTYTVHLKIIESAQPLLELKLVVPSRQIAKNVYVGWENKGDEFYKTVFANLIDIGE